MSQPQYAGSLKLYVRPISTPVLFDKRRFSFNLLPTCCKSFECFTYTAILIHWQVIDTSISGSSYQPFVVLLGVPAFQVFRVKIVRWTSEPKDRVQRK